MRHQRGFTLVEIMVVVIIIGLLAGLVGTTVISRLETARVDAAKTDLRTIEMALRMYRVDNFGYPTTEMGLLALVEEPVSASVPNWNSAGYLDDDEVPVDPWGTEYQYLSPGLDGSDYDLYSLGADGKPGGDEAGADISASDL